MPREKKRNKAELKAYVSRCPKVETERDLQCENDDPVGIVVATLIDNRLAKHLM